MTTPNGTNVLDIYDPTGSQITHNSGYGLSVSISPAANPDYRPLGFDVLGTWTCQCNNSDGRVVAYTASWELVIVSDIHEHNTISIFSIYYVCICALLHNIAYSALMIYQSDV